MGELNPIEIPIYTINFLVTLVFLYLLLYKPVSKYLGDRKERIANSLKEAETMTNEAETALQEAKSELAGANEKARQLSHEAIDNAALDAEDIIENAKEKAAEIIAQAREQMEAERQAALERAYTDLVSFASGLASRILSREVTIDDNREIVDRFFRENEEKDKNGGDIQAENRPESEIAQKDELTP